MYVKRTTLAVALSLMGAAAWADNVQELENITVRATPNNLPARSVSEVRSQDILQKNPVDLKALLQEQVGVEVDALPRLRQGNDSVNIRGLNGNRVGMDIDGIPLPEAQESRLFSSVGMAFGRGHFVDNSGLASAMVSRGTEANGLAGSVNFRTLSPDDLLTLPNRAWGAYVQSQYNSADRSTAVTGAGALRQGAWQGMILGTYRYGHETKTRGDVGGNGANRTKANPTDYTSRYFLTKHDFDVDAANRLTLTGEYLNRNQAMESLSSYGANTTQDTMWDNNDRKRVSLAHRFHGSGSLKDAQTQVYYQDSETENLRIRSNPRTDTAFTRDKVWGANGQYVNVFNGAFKPILRYGFQLAHHDLTNNLITTSAANRKPFADTKQINAALFAEGELSWQDWVITPALRWDYYRLNPSDSNGYVQLGADTTRIEKQTANEFSPRLGLTWKFDPMFKPYLQYSHGFKAPSSQQLTTSFGQSIRTPFFSVDYAVVGNPNLKPETANNFELGVRGHSDAVDYHVAVYDNRYRHFIDYVMLDNSMSHMRLQYQNFEKARIYGSEASATWRFAPNWRANGSIAYAKGRTEGADGKQPINSIMPVKVKLGVAYEQTQWGANAHLTYSAKKSDKDIASSTLGYNPSRRYALVDLGGYWQPTRNVRVSANVNNVFNQKYWNWADLAHLAARSNNSGAYDNGVSSITQDNADAYSATGRSFNVGIRYTF